jgi:hypothetical protein
MYVHIFRPHNTAQLETQYVGPFATFEDVYEYHCSLPALGVYIEAEDGFIGEGVKTWHELTPPVTE